MQEGKVATMQGDLFMKECKAIEVTLRAQRVRAKPRAPRVTPAYVMYPLALHPEETIANVERAMPQIALQLSNVRRKATHVRLQHVPLIIEAPHPTPQALAWAKRKDNVAHAMLAGRGYTFAGPEEQIVHFDTSPHTLVAGITGSGKSVLMQGMALSAAESTSPAEMRYMVVDLKRDDLVPLQGLPHTIDFAGDPDAALRAIDFVHKEMERRRDMSGKAAWRLVLWIDELAQLPHEAQEQIKVITALGRSMHINVVAATQHPTAEVLGGSVGKINYTTRLVGLVADATAASTATGRAKTGAELLPGRGSFVRVEGATMVRFQSYLLDHADLRRMIRGVRERWNGVVPAHAVQRGAAAKPDGLEAVFAEYHDGGGDLQRGGLAAAIRALYGDEARSSGRIYQDQRDAVMQRFAQWLDSMQ